MTARECTLAATRQLIVAFKGLPAFNGLSHWAGHGDPGAEGGASSPSPPACRCALLTARQLGRILMGLVGEADEVKDLGDGVRVEPSRAD